MGGERGGGGGGCFKTIVIFLTITCCDGNLCSAGKRQTTNHERTRVSCIDLSVLCLV
jgi:hypothetical protein